MKFLIDNALSPQIAYELRDAGHDAVHIRDIGMAACSDNEIFDFAEQERRIILSADTDFGTILALRQAAFPSFILFRRTDKRPLAQLQFLLAHLDQIKDDLNNGAVVVLEDKRIRIRSLPF